MTDSRFHQFIKSLTAVQLDGYACCCKTSPGYITGHLVNGYKTPRKELMAALVLNSGGQLTREDVLEHFFPSRLFELTDAA